MVSALLPFMAAAQGQINTKKTKIADFPQKVTKVVLNGNPFYDGSLQEEIASRWRVSPYEFCTLEEFEQLKGSDQYYFLLITEGQFKKESEPGLQFITLVKGGEGSDKGIDGMLEVATLPFAAAEFPSGRELVFLPALLDIIQNYTLASIEKDYNVLGGLSAFATNPGKTSGKKLVFAKEDLSPEISEGVINKYFKEGTTVMEADDADIIIADSTPDTIVSYIVAPTEAGTGSFCYKMLIDSSTHELYYFRKHRITKKLGSGFLDEDIRRICAPRK